MFKEFKEFAMRGNVVDLAVGVIIGVAFGAIVNSLVTDIIMPPIGLLMGGLDFKDLFVSLNGQVYPTLDAAKKAGAPVIAYGAFLNTIVNFLIVAFAIFLLVKQINRMQKPVAAPAAVPTKECPYCITAVPVKASRCPACTSEIPSVATA